VRPVGQKELGSKIEIKNMNSFSGVRRALEYEIPRQIETVKNGQKLSQETRRWDDIAGITETMRTKEQAHDYRYFPEPDLMPFEPTEAWLEEVSKRVVELPLARKQRFMSAYQLPASDAQTFVWDVPLGNYFEKTVVGAKNPKTIANWVINNLRAKLAEYNDRIVQNRKMNEFLGQHPGAKLVALSAANAAKELGVLSEADLQTRSLTDLKFTPESLQELVNLIENKTISSSTAQQVFAEMFDTGEAPSAIVQEKGLAQVSDTAAIEKLCGEAIAANPKTVEDYRGGKVAALNSLKGQVMKLSRGKANPVLVGEILERKLKG
jgi:aspartyl-tRNA(Asn)/glutamyl-tRNA(Gln) amidotransferase subunit B